MEQAFRWAFIGTGRLAGQVAKEITASGRHRITSVYTRRPERCAEFAAAYGAYAAASAEEAVSRPDVDGVYIVTPHTSHAEYSLLSMRLGRPVLCEKPVTTDARQAAEMIRLSEEKGIYFSEAMWTWFSPVANKVKEWLDAGEYGEIRIVINSTGGSLASACGMLQARGIAGAKGHKMSVLISGQCCSAATMLLKLPFPVRAGDILRAGDGTDGGTVG